MQKGYLDVMDYMHLFQYGFRPDYCLGHRGGQPEIRPVTLLVFRGCSMAFKTINYGPI